MPFKKGQSGNPKGRPPAPERDSLRDALDFQGKKLGKSFWVHVAEQAFKDNSILKVVVGKFVPEMKEIQLEGNLTQTTIVTPEQEALARQLVDMWVKSKQPKTPKPEKDAPTS